MDCQNTIKNLKINEEKNIGTTLIIVEGESDEFKLLNHIFAKILNYDYYSQQRNKVLKHKYQSKKNKNSKVIVANTSSSNIKTIIDYKEQDKLYNLLKEEFNESLKNVRIYILWDRDKDKNDKVDNNYKYYEKSLDIFANSMDNGYEMNGLILLSYPCHEAYNLSNFKKRSWTEEYITSKDCKKAFHESQYSISNIDKKTLLLAVENMHHIMKNYNIIEYDPSDFKIVNKTIFRKEEEYFKINKRFNTLSLISIMLIDLGIIDIKYE